MISEGRKRRRGARRAPARRRPPGAYGAAGSPQRRRREPLPAGRAAAVVLVLVAALLAVAWLRAGDDAEPAVELARPDPAELAPDGRPTLQLLATTGGLRLEVPIRQTRITAIVYHGVGERRTMALEPAGQQLNQSFLAGIAERLFGSPEAGPRFYVDGSAPGPDTGSVDVGAPAGTSIWSPVDGTVVGIRPYIINGRQWGSVLQLRPSEAPSAIVTLTNLRRARGVAVGTNLVAGRSRLGAVHDLSEAIDQNLARFTADAGNHVHVEVNPAPAASPLL
jgi:hypothetical protein